MVGERVVGPVGEDERRLAAHAHLVLGGEAGDLLVEEPVGHRRGQLALATERRARAAGAQAGLQELEDPDRLDEVVVGVAARLGDPVGRGDEPDAAQEVLPCRAVLAEERVVGDLAADEVVGRGHGHVLEHARAVVGSRGAVGDVGERAQAGVDEPVLAFAHARLDERVPEHRLAVARQREALDEAVGVVREAAGLRAALDLQRRPRSRHGEREPAPLLGHPLLLGGPARVVAAGPGARARLAVFASARVGDVGDDAGGDQDRDDQRDPRPPRVTAAPAAPWRARKAAGGRSRRRARRSVGLRRRHEKTAGPGPSRPGARQGTEASPPGQTLPGVRWTPRLGR